MYFGGVSESLGVYIKCKYCRGMEASTDFIMPRWFLLLFWGFFSGVFCVVFVCGFFLGERDMTRVCLLLFGILSDILRGVPEFTVAKFGV